MSDYEQEAQLILSNLTHAHAHGREHNMLLLQRALVAAHLNGLREAKAIVDAPVACASHVSTTTNKEIC